MLSGAAAYTTWSVEKNGVQGKGFPCGKEENSVVNFRTCGLCLPGRHTPFRRPLVGLMTDWHLLLSGDKRRRRDRPQTGVLTPGTSALTKLSHESATEYITYLISNCLCLCRPFGTFCVVAQLPGVNTPVCGLSSLRDFRVSPHWLHFAREADG